MFGDCADSDGCDRRRLRLLVLCVFKLVVRRQLVGIEEKCRRRSRSTRERGRWMESQEFINLSV